MNLSDSDEDIFPRKDSVTTVNIHDEEQAIKSKNIKTAKAKKTSPKKRATYNKLSVQKNSSSKENESPEIPASNFYAKNKNSDVDESNNNKLETIEDLTNCPICNRPFPVSKIEVYCFVIEILRGCYNYFLNFCRYMLRTVFNTKVKILKRIVIFVMNIYRIKR